ncbi:MAG: peptidyl-arginine deiminase [Methanosarcinales archaeon]|nr:peptidyl-arginine deiminase [Methanosarcinales archaeon]
MKRVTIGLVQTAVSEDLEINLDRTLERVREAIDRGARIICLQELYRTRYFPQQDGLDASGLAETIPGQSTRAFSELAREAGVVIIVPLFERAGHRFYNSVAVIDADGELLSTYRKVHVPHDPLFYEKSYFQPGDHFQVYRTRHADFAVLICYDQWFPEAARIVALQGADVIFYPTAIGWISGQTPAEGDWHDAWETIQRSHAIANSVHVAAVNRVGREGDLIFWGSSFVCDSFGRVLARAGDRGEEVLVAELDLDMNREVREGWGFFRNRRPDAYRLLVEETQGRSLTFTQSAQIPQTPPPLPPPQTPRTLQISQTPRSLGYHMPAEWEPHEAIWLSWPYDLDSFPAIDRVEQSYLSIIEAISRSELVNLLVRDGLMRDRVLAMLQDRKVSLDQVRFHLADYADVWFRDYGPTFVVNRREGRLAMVSWIFNAWGEKYRELIGDSKIPAVINRDLQLPMFHPGIILEGGSIEVNGRGTLLTTEQCLLNPNRNPHLSREQIEEYLREYLGVSHIIWLKDGIAGDDTDGHVDDIARFVNPTTVLCAWEEDREDENYQPLEENYRILKESRDQDGNPLQVIRLPMPGRVGGKRRLPASYANFYIGNRAVLVPVFGHRHDSLAQKIIQEAFPERRVVGIAAEDLVHGLGTVHCISQQQPEV